MAFSILLLAPSALTPSAFAQNDWSRRAPNYFDVSGSWFGRAVPQNPFCTPGSEGCPLPKEIVMIFTFNDDHTFIGIDSNIFAGGNHSTAHGQWTPRWPADVDATFTLLQSDAKGVFIGGFKNLFSAHLTETNKMEGFIDAYLYLYTRPDGSVITDADGLPTPSPLDPPSLCDPSKGCVPLGKFTFKARRVTVQK